MPASLNKDRTHSFALAVEYAHSRKLKTFYRITEGTRTLYCMTVAEASTQSGYNIFCGRPFTLDIYHMVKGDPVLKQVKS